MKVIQSFLSSQTEIRKLWRQSPQGYHQQDLGECSPGLPGSRLRTCCRQIAVHPVKRRVIYTTLRILLPGMMNPILTPSPIAVPTGPDLHSNHLEAFRSVVSVDEIPKFHHRPGFQDRLIQVYPTIFQYDIDKRHLGWQDHLLDYLLTISWFVGSTIGQTSFE